MRGLAAGRRGFWRKVAAFVALGSIGILVLIPINAATISVLPQAPARPFLLAFLAALQPLALLFLGAMAGAFAAPRSGLRSLLAERLEGASPRPDDEAFEGAARLFAVSMALGIAAVALDELARPLWLPASADFPLYAQGWSPTTLLFGLAYGGLTEEIMMRWGLMSLLAWILWRMRGCAAAAHPGAMRGAIVLSALLFAAGHIPFMAAILPLAPGPVARTLLLNAIIGIWLGWLYWRRCLEMAMLGHAGIHCGFAAYAIVMIAIGAA